MKPETHAWAALHAQAATMIRPGFAERTLAAARAAAPTLWSQAVLSAATAAACALLAFGVNQHLNNVEAARNLADWQAVAAQADQISELP